METIRFSQLLGIYGLTALIFFAIDLLWLGIVAKDLYAHHLGGLLKEKVNWWAAVLFYLVYIGGILAFVLVPALQNGNGILWAVMYGAMLGLFAYCTFDLTCLALVRGWPVSIALIDILWGTVLTGTTAGVSLWLAVKVFKI